MPPDQGIRIREPEEADGIIWGSRAAGRKYGRYGFNTSVCAGLVRRGIVRVLAPASGPGHPAGLSDGDIRRYIRRDYKPHRDNKNRKFQRRLARKTREKSTPANSPPHSVAGDAPIPDYEFLEDDFDLEALKYAALLVLASATPDLEAPGTSKVSDAVLARLRDALSDPFIPDL